MLDISSHINYTVSMMNEEIDMKNIVDICYEGYLLAVDNPLSKEEWIELPAAKRFINKMKKTYKKRGVVVN